MAGQTEHAADGVLRAAVMLLPETKAKNRRSGAPSLVVTADEQTPRGRMYAERVEIISADFQSFHEMRFPALRQIKSGLRPREDPGENVLLITNLFPDGIG